MSWNYKHRKWRELIRQRYTEETGSTDYKSRDFAAWAERQLAK